MFKLDLVHSVPSVLTEVNKNINIFLSFSFVTLSDCFDFRTCVKEFHRMFIILLYMRMLTLMAASQDYH